MPTKTEQSNLNHLIFSGHGEIPRVVLAPGTVEESFYLDGRRLQPRREVSSARSSSSANRRSARARRRCRRSTSDGVRIDRGKLIADGEVVFGEYKRFEFTDDGVSPRVIPGVEGGMHLAAGSEHNDAGVITENADNRAPHDGQAHAQARVDARRTSEARSCTATRRRGSRSSATAATAGRSSRRRIGWRAAGIATRFLQLRTLWPFPEDDVARVLRERARRIFVVENNYTGQLERLIRYVVGPLPTHALACASTTASRSVRSRSSRRSSASRCANSSGSRGRIR